MADDKLRSELIKKYQWAGKIRFISFSLLFIFLILMKLCGGYSYFTFTFVSLIFVEAVLNQPYAFFIKKVNIYRFQFYQMIVDIIVISWMLYLMGGLEAPIVSIVYCAVILWAGVVSGEAAVLFAVFSSSIFFSSVIILEHFGALPAISYFNYKIPAAQMLTLLFGNVAFMFAFGYFSAHSSGVIKFLERKRQEDSLRYMHKLLAAGYLVGGTAHDILNYLATIKGNIQMLSISEGQSGEQRAMLKSIIDSESRCANLVYRLARFSKEPEKEFAPTDINKAIEDAFELTWPLVRYSKMAVEKVLKPKIPLIPGDRNEIQEVFVTLILNSLDAVSGKPKGGTLTVKTEYLEDKELVEIIFTDTGIGIGHDELKQIGAPFFSTKGPEKGAGLGLATAYSIVERHNGRIDVKSKPGEGATFIIQLPLKEKYA
ncbi:MAG: hypothetical protein KKF80_02750 [Candidatus Omnitrophica bacterium]|nr:hypothetical protein [Candidatus Omnitrophota bacterium]